MCHFYSIKSLCNNRNEDIFCCIHKYQNKWNGNILKLFHNIFKRAICYLEGPWLSTGKSSVSLILITPKMKTILQGTLLLLAVNNV